MKTYKIRFKAKSSKHVETETVKAVNLFQAIRSINDQHAANVHVIEVYSDDVKVLQVDETGELIDQ